MGFGFYFEQECMRCGGKEGCELSIFKGSLSSSCLEDRLLRRQGQVQTGASWKPPAIIWAREVAVQVWAVVSLDIFRSFQAFAQLSPFQGGLLCELKLFKFATCQPHLEMECYCFFRFAPCCLLPVTSLSLWPNESLAQLPTSRISLWTIWKWNHRVN